MYPIESVSTSGRSLTTVRCTASRRTGITWLPVAPPTTALCDSGTNVSPSVSRWEQFPCRSVTCVCVNTVVASCCVCVSPSSCALTLWPAPCTAWGSAALTCTQPWPTRWRLWTSARASSKSCTHRNRPCVQNSSYGCIFGNYVFSSFCICPPELNWRGGSLRSFTFYWCLPWYWHFTFLSLENPG